MHICMCPLFVYRADSLVGRVGARAIRTRLSLKRESAQRHTMCGHRSSVEKEWGERERTSGGRGGAYPEKKRHAAHAGTTLHELHRAHHALETIGEGRGRAKKGLVQA